MFKTYTISHFLKNTDLSRDYQGDAHFHINRLENMPTLPPSIVTPHKHHFYELFLVCEGTATHAVDYQEYTLTKNTFFFIAQGQLHFWATTNRENIRGYRLMFTEDFFQMNQTDNQFLFELIHLDNIYQNPLILVSPKLNSFIFTYFELILQEFERENTYDRALQSLLYLLLSEVHRLLKSPLPSESTKHQAVVFKQFTLLLETHFTKKWSASDYADALFMSVRHLNRIIQSITNQSLTQVIQNRTVLEAKRLLTFSNLQ